MSEYSTDKRAEEELGKFVDEYFYPWVVEKYGYGGFRRVWDRAEQLLGVDVVIYKGNRDCIVDEKASLRYMNRTLNTFAFELSFLRRGEETVGWFLKENMKTQYYEIMYPKSDVDISDVKKDDFTSVEILIIPVARIWKYLNSIGFTKDDISERANDIRVRGEKGRLHAGRYIDGIYISATAREKLEEEPINLVISKDRLKKAASAHFLVTKEKTIII